MKNKQSGIGNRARVKRFKHDGMIKKKGLWRSVTGVKYLEGSAALQHLYRSHS